MSKTFTKSMARNIFYGGAVFSFLLFVALTMHTTRSIPQRSNEQNLTAEVAHSKIVWETNNCIGCLVSYNPGYQNLLKGMKPSTRQRFVALQFNFPSPALEQAILSGETGIDDFTAKQLVAIAGHLRAL